jgi:hypothetical protein
MSSYRCAPPQGCLDWLKRMYGYLRWNPSSGTRFLVNIPIHEALATPAQYGWSSAVYGPITEELPPDQPIPCGKLMRTTPYLDANLYHDIVTGCAMSDVFHFVNQTPISSYCKKQKTDQTATYGSKLWLLSNYVGK